MYPYYGKPPYYSDGYPRYEVRQPNATFYPYPAAAPYMYYHPRRSPNFYHDYTHEPLQHRPDRIRNHQNYPLRQPFRSFRSEPRFRYRLFHPPERMSQLRPGHPGGSSGNIQNPRFDVYKAKKRGKKSSNKDNMSLNEKPMGSSTPSTIVNSFQTVEVDMKGIQPASIRPPLTFGDEEGVDLESVMMNESAQSVDLLSSNLREKLIHQLRNGTLQCLVCLSKVNQRDPIWSCTVCFHIYHLTCIKLWADKCRATPGLNSSTTQANPTDQPPSWRCPSCQTKQVTDNDGDDDQLKYTCFCGRVRNPKYHPARSTIPHGCDEICQKSRAKPFYPDEELSQYVQQTVCIHPCTELCHPGPCPTCCASVQLHCPCGKVKSANVCGDPPPLPCGQLCDQNLVESKCASNLHSCLYKCHFGVCPPCPWVLQTACFCGAEKSPISCGSEEAKRIRFTPELLDLLQVSLIDFLQTLSTQSSSTQSDETLQLTNDGIAELSADLSNTSISAPQPGEIPIPSLPPLFHTPPVVTFPPSFSCSRPCGRTLTCGKHVCTDPCHMGECKPCVLDPSSCYTCPCGRVPLSKVVSSGDPHGDRTSCSDPVPVCPNICARPHPVCGHPCPSICHEGPCPPCQLSISVKCCCGRTSKEMTCLQYEESTKADGDLQTKCAKVCKKQKPCGRHKCKKKCCDLSVHSCEEICGRTLSCQQHQCEEPCHSGPCGTCWRGVIYTELYCRCGYTVLHPPQPCGTGPPECNQPCLLGHECAHPVRHTCHSEASCPPCTVLMTKECPGGHGVQFSLPCFQPVLSCGRVCGKRLLNCSHTCPRLCHKSDCLELNPDQRTPSTCKQPCQKPRPDCGHPCGLACHEAEGQTCLQAAVNCPKSPGRTGLLPCREMINVICPCGHRKSQQSCHQVHSKIAMMNQQSDTQSQLARILETFQSIKLTKKSDPIPILPCDDSCARAAEQEAAKDSEYADTTNWKRGFETDGAAAGGEGQLLSEPPEYTEFLKKYALGNFAFAVGIERQLYSMVLRIWETSKQPEAEMLRVVDHHFSPMNKRRRRFVSELVEFYGMDAYVVDPGPSCHVMVIGKRGQIRMPGGATDHRGSLTNCLQREFTSAALHIQEGIRVPKKSNPALHEVPTTSTSRVSYAQILKPSRHQR